MRSTYRPAQMDGVTAVVTWFVILLFAVLLALALFYGEWPMVIGAAFLGIIIAMSWQLRPIRYEITGDAVGIVRGRPFRSIVIPVADMREVRRVTLPATTIRTFGIGGLFGWVGWFWNKDLGRFFMAATHRKHTVLIANGKKFVISPENPDEFIADVRSRVKSD